MLKSCTKCGESKELALFPAAKRAKDGRDTRCNACAAKATALYRSQHPDKVAAVQRAHYTKNAKRLAEKVKAWSDANTERRREHRKRWRDANIDLARQIERAYAEANPEKVAARRKAYWAANKPKWAHYAMKRKAAKLRATPIWANEDAILAVYRQCAEATELTGIPHEVDHIVPLQGATVSGLHVEYNLRVIPMLENRRKANNLLEIPA